MSDRVSSASPPTKTQDTLGTLNTSWGERNIARLSGIEELAPLPHSLKILAEAVLRQSLKTDHSGSIAELLESFVGYQKPGGMSSVAIPFRPARVVLQDFTGVPALVDLAAMRSALVAATGSPESARMVNPQVPADLVIDHSVQVDSFGHSDSILINTTKEFERNQERYRFLKWGQLAFDNLTVVPPETGIVHQVNLEYLAKVVWDQDGWLFPDTLVGTDSHTTMINGLGVVGWGVGGIEAEAVLVGQPIYMRLPEVVGFRLSGRLPPGSTATDLVLRVTEMLRNHGVVGKFVEFFGPGLTEMPVANRATIANMAPEYGATIGYFPVDEKTLEYLENTGRPPKLIEEVEAYYKEQGLWGDSQIPPLFHSGLELDLGTVQPALAGPKRPQDRVLLTEMKTDWQRNLTEVLKPAATGNNSRDDLPISKVEVSLGNGSFPLSDGSVLIAAITSCTNTSNPEVMIGAGLLARKARERGLDTQPWVKTSLAPGSKVVTEYLTRSGLLSDLEGLGFHVVGYGCTTCIGNSGPLLDPIVEAVIEHQLVGAAVLSGNRNFEGRISPHVRANYLASPPLVVAYALTGSVNWDPVDEPVGAAPDGSPVYLKEIWPSGEEVGAVMREAISRADFLHHYGEVTAGPDSWRQIEVDGDLLYPWSTDSTYVHHPPFFQQLESDPEPIEPIKSARVLARLGDSVTTDHISPAGAIPVDSPAGQYLLDRGVQHPLFNSYGSRRGNDEVMVRGTFANIRFRNQLTPGKEGGWTRDFTDGEVKWIFDAAGNYREAGIPLVVLAGADYGMGSSRDWAAKGPLLLGVKAVIAVSYERIHRSNLVMMGILPLQFLSGQSADTLGLTGSERLDIQLDPEMSPGSEVTVSAHSEDGTIVEFTTRSRLDLPIELEYYRHGGILNFVLRDFISEYTNHKS